MGYGRGGARPGAGRPKGGVSDARRLLLAGLQRALAASATASGLVAPGASEEEQATVGIANIAQALIAAGRGDEVVKLYALSVTKITGSDDGASPQSPFLAALARLPGMVAGAENGTDPAQMAPVRQSLIIDSTACGTEPADRKSDAPAVNRLPSLMPQAVLDLSDAVRASTAEPSMGAEWAPVGRRPAPAGPVTPHPPQATGPVRKEGGAENFEFHAGVAPAAAGRSSRDVSA